MVTVIGENRPRDGALWPQTATMDGGTSRATAGRRLLDEVGRPRRV